MRDPLLLRLRPCNSELGVRAVDQVLASACCEVQDDLFNGTMSTTCLESFKQPVPCAVSGLHTHLSVWELGNPDLDLEVNQQTLQVRTCRSFALRGAPCVGVLTLSADDCSVMCVAAGLLSRRSSA